MNSQVLWTEYKSSHDMTTKKKIILQYTNLVHYVIQHSRFVAQNVVDEEDYFQFGVEGFFRFSHRSGMVGGGFEQEAQRNGGQQDQAAAGLDYLFHH